jgi:hypothetical protein
LRDKTEKQQFSTIQVDESTDFNNKSYVVVFVRFVNDGEIQENFFCYKELPLTSKAQDTCNVWKQNVCLGRTVQACVLAEPHKWLAPFQISPPLQKRKKKS